MWTNALVIGCVVSVIMSTAILRSRSTLVQQLEVFRSSIRSLVPFVFAVGIAYAMEFRVEDPSRLVARGEEVDAAWFASIKEAQMATSVLVAGLTFVITLLGVQLIMVLTSARRFVITQEIDLVARDQVAMHQVNAPDESEGVPVSGIGAPRPAEG